MELWQAGYLEDCFKVHTSYRENTLSFLEVEEVYLITYKPFIGFIVHLPDRGILFKKHGKMHEANFVTLKGHILVTQAYIKAEIECIQQVHELMCCIKR
jgi:hypothetical protein